MELMAQWRGRRQVEVWAYCPWPNHVHRIVAPSDEQGLAGAIEEAHCRYSDAHIRLTISTVRSTSIWPPSGPTCVLSITAL